MDNRLRVLYAEDNPADADLTKSHFALNAPEVDLECVDTGRECLSRLLDRRYDVLLLDHHLPDMDGIDLLREISEKHIPLPVVMVTGAGDESLVVQVLRLGAHDYVSKNGNYLESLPAVLKGAVAEYQELKEHGDTAGPTEGRILYVEHHRADIDLTCRHFAEAARHLSLEVVLSSGQALARVQESRFDLILTDLRMPDMNALDLLRELKRRGLAIPVIIITGQGDEETAVAALKLGGSDYIVKRDNYLVQLPYAIDHAIARSHLMAANRRLQSELEERRRAETEKAHLLSEVLAQRKRLNEIIASVPGIVWEMWGSPEGPGRTMHFVSDHAERILGYDVERWLTTPNFWLSIVHPDDRECAARQATESYNRKQNGISRFRWLAADGREVWVEARSTVICDDAGNPIGMRGVTMDISAAKEAEAARTQLEEQLRQSQKMESVGRLAGGVAHDFNNLLTVINGHSSLALQQLQPGDPLRSRLEDIRKAGDRAADLTRQLLALSRRQLLVPRVLDLNALITESTSMLRRLLGEDIELVTLLDPGSGRVKSDAGQLNQVILNLAVNARDAMPRGGKLILETRDVIFDEERGRTDPSVPPGSYVMLGITDSGSGMDAEIVSHMFEPFFTTKELGKGTGLGLSTVYGIVKQSGGSIGVDSRPGQGTSFKIYLPRIEEPLAEVEKKPAETERIRGSETILIVEDDEMVRRLVCQALRMYGYQVVEAANAGEALLICETHQRSLPLMVTDIVMPQLSGQELAARLAPLHPKMRVIYLSGYTDDAVVRHGVLNSTTFFLQKPFTPIALVKKVREVLDQQET
jgi:PAS domain S-box-containing protein